MNAESLARSLGGKKIGSVWKAKCPAHDDNNPSLDIEDIGGKVVFCCRANCSQAEVLRALRAMGLWAEDNARSGPYDYPSRITARYDYHDERRELLYTITRHEPTANEPKPFRPWHVNAVGKWVQKKHPRQVLYRLPEVLKAPLVFLVEGEKDVDTLRANGFTATTNAGGAKAPWLPDYTKALTGREVILIPDNDNPGRERVLRIVHELRALSPTVLELPGVKDVTEWFDAGHGETELIKLIEAKEVRQ